MTKINSTRIPNFQGINVYNQTAKKQTSCKTLEIKHSGSLSSRAYASPHINFNGGLNKLLAKIASQNKSIKDLSIHDAVKVLEHLGYVAQKETGSSHLKYAKEGCSKIYTLARHGSTVHPETARRLKMEILNKKIIHLSNKKPIPMKVPDTIHELTNHDIKQVFRTKGHFALKTENGKIIQVKTKYDGDHIVPSSYRKICHFMHKVA